MLRMFDSATVLWHYLATKKLLDSVTTRDDVEQLQKDGLARFRATVMSRSPFYRQYADKPLSEIPIISKKDMLENFDQMNTAGIKLEDALSVGLKAENERDFSPMIGNITVGLSSGTSGDRGVFLVSKSERLRWAGAMLAHAMPHSILKPTRIAFFLRANSNLYTTLNRGRHLKLDFYDITQGRLLAFKNRQKPCTEELFSDRLSRTQPDVLVAPASVLRRLAHLKYVGNFHIAPKRIFSVGEVLEPEDKTYIEEMFQLPVHQIYQCTEGFLGISDKTGTMLLNEAFVIIEKEWIDRASGRFRPIITDFSRSTQPIIRYRLDDILVEDDSHHGPFTAIREIEGRADSTLYFRTPDGGLRPVFADAVRQAVLASHLRGAQYQIIQTSPDALEMKWGPAPQFVPGFIHTKTLQTVLDELAARYGCIAPKGSVSPSHQQPYDVKVRRIIRTFPVNDGDLR